ncbi:MAG: NifB/NifX family molybdenum-iron cluster-binding protein [Planctomycetaceae bacterium]
MVLCVPVTADGAIDPRWGRADRVAVVETTGDAIGAWQEFDVGWNAAHDAGGEGAHHARVARFLLEHHVEAVVANHMGPGMLHMVERMGIAVHLGAEGDARAAVVSTLAGHTG